MKYKRSLRIPRAANHENVVFVSTDANHSLYSYLVHTLSTWDDVYNLQETLQYRQRMHHSNPDKQCQVVDILHKCGHLFPKCLRKQKSRQVPLGSGGCPC
jgi:hypothetical protein